MRCISAIHNDVLPQQDPYSWRELANPKKAIGEILLGKRRLEFPQTTPEPIALLARQCLGPRAGRPSTAALVRMLKELRSKGRKIRALSPGTVAAVELQAVASVEAVEGKRPTAPASREPVDIDDNARRGAGAARRSRSASPAAQEGLQCNTSRAATPSEQAARYSAVSRSASPDARLASSSGAYAAI